MKTAKKIIAGDRTDQIEMAGGNTILSARGGHTDEFERSEISREEGKSCHPRRNISSRKEEISRGLHIALERKSDPNHKGDVEPYNRVINEGQVNG